MRAVKYHALGNDYLVIDPMQPDFKLSTELVQRICHRNYGVGADGILLGPSGHKKPYKLSIFNPDGSQAEKSGNGLRIFSRYLYEYRDAGDAFEISTSGSTVPVEIQDKAGSSVKVMMGKPEFGSDKIPLETNDKEVFGKVIPIDESQFPFFCVSMGNPHCVIPVPALNTDVVKKYGPLIENFDLFPNRTNVQFARLVNRRTVEIEIWERGAGYTLASGSSSCAVAAVFYRLGKIDKQAQIKMPGGALFIEIEGDLEKIWMTGAVSKVYEATLADELLSV